MGSRKTKDYEYNDLIKFIQDCLMNFLKWSKKRPGRYKKILKRDTNSDSLYSESSSGRDEWKEPIYLKNTNPNNATVQDEWETIINCTHY